MFCVEIADETREREAAWRVIFCMEFRVCVTSGWREADLFRPSIICAHNIDTARSIGIISSSKLNRIYFEKGDFRYTKHILYMFNKRGIIFHLITWNKSYENVNITAEYHRGSLFLPKSYFVYKHYIRIVSIQFV